MLGRLTLDSWSTTAEIEEVATAALQHPSLIEGVAEFLFHDAAHVRGKAARVLAVIAQQQPRGVQPYKDLLIQEVAHGEHWLARYSFCNLITRLSLTPGDVEQVKQILMAYLNDESNGVKAAAMQALVELTRLQPALKEEVLPIIETLTQTGTPAMRARGRKLLKRLYRAENRQT